MKSILKVIGLLLVCVLFFNGSESDSFEGKIFFKSYKQGQEEIYVYYVKGNQVRLDQIQNGIINGTILVNTSTKEMHALTPKHKIYYERKYNPTQYPIRKDVKVEKTGEYKEIKGFKCQKVKVSDQTKGSSITYYIAEKNFDFFRPLLKTLNRKENLSVNYHQVQGLERDFPFLGIEKNSEGKVVQRLQVTLIQEEEVKEGMFEIPYDFEEQSY